MREERILKEGLEASGGGGKESSLPIGPGLEAGLESMTMSWMEVSRRIGIIGGSIDIVRPRRMGDKVGRGALGLVLRVWCRMLAEAEDERAMGAGVLRFGGCWKAVEGGSRYAACDVYFGGLCTLMRLLRGWGSSSPPLSGSETACSRLRLPL